MRELPILFNVEMVKAILSDQKVQTRRPIKPQPETFTADQWGNLVPIVKGSPFGQPEDSLWVRETFYCDHIDYPDAPLSEMLSMLEYRATHDCGAWEAGCPCAPEGEISYWKPSIHMPKWASRINLRVKWVWVERVQDISLEDIQAEGIVIPSSIAVLSESLEPTMIPLAGRDPWCFFSQPWNSIYADKGLGWDANPWVWCCEFERIEKVLDR